MKKLCHIETLIYHKCHCSLKKNFLCNLASRIVFWVSLIVFDENKTSFTNEFLIVLTIHSKKRNAYLLLVKLLLLWSMSNHFVNIRAQWTWEQTCWKNCFQIMLSFQIRKNLSYHYIAYSKYSYLIMNIIFCLLQGINP